MIYKKNGDGGLEIIIEEKTEKEREKELYYPCCNFIQYSIYIRGYL